MGTTGSSESSGNSRGGSLAQEPSTNLLTWSDVAKLCIPFAFSLLLVWFRVWFETRRERRARKEALWRLFVQNADGLRAALDELQRVADAYEAGRVRIVALSTPHLAAQLATRLSELEPQGAYLYGDLVDAVCICDAGITRLQSFVDAAIGAGNAVSAELKKAISNQVASLKKDLLALARSELSVMDHLRKEGQHDEQDLVRLRTAVGNAESQVR